MAKRNIATEAATIIGDSQQSAQESVQASWIPRRTFTHALFVGAILLGLCSPFAQAKPKQSTVALVPTINNIAIADGALTGSGEISVSVRGKTQTATFSDVPVEISISENRGLAPCPALKISLGAITVNLGGVMVHTSPICMRATGYIQTGAFGDVLCTVGRLLEAGLTMDEILAGESFIDPITGATVVFGLTAEDLITLTTGLTNLLNAALGTLQGSVLTSIEDLKGRACSILHFQLNPTDFVLLGIAITNFDNCESGAVKVDITIVKGGLCANRFCSLVSSARIHRGLTLSQTSELLANALLNE